MSIYDNLTFKERTDLRIDKVYNSRTEMDAAAAEDNVFIGRYVLVSYDDSTELSKSEGYQKDYETYENNRGYNNTVWEKVFIDNKFSYRKIAELDSYNLLGAAFGMTMDVPSQKPNVSLIKEADKYIIHAQPSPGLLIGDIEYNKAGFNKEIRTYSNKMNSITAEFKGKSGQEYNGVQKVDSYQLDIILPIIGNIICEMWDYIGGKDRDFSLKASSTVLEEMNDISACIRNIDRIIGEIVPGDEVDKNLMDWINEIKELIGEEDSTELTTINGALNQVNNKLKEIESQDFIKSTSLFIDKDDSQHYIIEHPSYNEENATTDINNNKDEIEGELALNGEDYVISFEMPIPVGRDDFGHIKIIQKKIKIPIQKKVLYDVEFNAFKEMVVNDYIKKSELNGAMIRPSNIYKITFAGNNATSGVPDPITRVYGENVTFPSDLPVRAGYTFNGWLHAGTNLSDPNYKTEETKGTYMNGAIATPKTNNVCYIAGDSTYVATWIKN